MNESQAREEICRVGESLFARGYVHATAGNISVRIADGFLITPTDACLGYLDPALIAKVDGEGRQISGAKASKTLVLHQAIYEAASHGRPATACVIHTHSTHCVALSLVSAPGEFLPPITPYFVMKVGHVPHLRYHRPGDPAVASLVQSQIRNHDQAGHPIRAVMLNRLGPNVWHDSPAQAMAVLEELEETARLWLMSQPRPAPLTDTMIQELREQFGACW